MPWKKPQKSTVVLFGSAKALQRDQQTLDVQVYTFLYMRRSMKVLLLLICLCPGWIWETLKLIAFLLLARPWFYCFTRYCDLHYPWNICCCSTSLHWAFCSGLSTWKTDSSSPAPWPSLPSTPWPAPTWWVRGTGSWQGRSRHSGGHLVPTRHLQLHLAWTPHCKDSHRCSGREAQATHQERARPVCAYISAGITWCCFWIQSCAISLGAAGALALCHCLLQLCAPWQDDGLSPHPNSMPAYPIPSSWSATGFPCPTFRLENPNPCTKGQSMGMMAFSHHSAIRCSGGTLETLSKLQSVIKAGEPLHISWEHADTVFVMSWLEQIPWYQGWEAGRWQVGKVPPLRLYNFLSSSSVTVCPYMSLRVAGCLRPEEVFSMGRQPAALPAAEGHTLPRSTSMRFLPLCTWSSKQRLWLKPGAVVHSGACGYQPRYLVNKIKIKILNSEHLFSYFVLFF